MERENTILVVDDDPNILFVTTRLLKKSDYKVLKTENGEQTLLLAQGTRFTLSLPLNHSLTDSSGQI